jgi:hypothetical protein
MEKHEETLCEANSKDYSMSFKLQIVQEIERGQLTVTESTKTYGIQNRTTVVSLENSVTLIGKTKHHLLCQSRQNKR